MRKRIMSIALIFVLSASCFVFSASSLKTINVSPNTVKVKVNGNDLNADNFNYNRTVYVPLS